MCHDGRVGRQTANTNTGSETNVYTFALLDPRNPVKFPEAAATNNTILNRGNTYGIEVTVPALAARCSHGNLDPQHTDGLNVSACKAALTGPLPATGTTLVTNRADADALLAMAVLYCRANGRSINTSIINIIDGADCTPNGPWIKNYTPHPLFAAMNWHCMNHSIPVDERVMRLVDILSGYGTELPSPPPVDYSGLTVETRDGFVIVHAVGSAGRGANGLGYKHAPIVVTTNPDFVLNGGQPHLKYGVARWNAQHPMDWDGMLAALRAIEPGWGGSRSICGSTQGEASTMTLDQVVTIVTEHLHS